jgi:hypothetical protein
MAIKKVDSSMVWAIDYDPKSQVLEVAFKRTGVFSYEGVPPSEYRNLLHADSIGSYLRTCIIGVYRERKLVD